jgi:hypothetical protein
MEFDPRDAVLENGYLEKGSPCAVCGMGGIGKSRLALQLAINTALRREFLGWKTNGEDLRWLFLQTENGNKRLKADLQATMDPLTKPERQIINESITIHTLENDDDGFLSLSNQHVVAALQTAMTNFAPDIVVFDPLRDFAIGDLNSDADMSATLSAISRIVRTGNPKRISLILHHALTGKAGSARAVGYDRQGFGRNSKVLQGYVRAMINIAPEQSDSNDSLIVASGKSNNSEEFQPFGIRLDPETMTYRRDDSIDIVAWRERIGADTKTADPLLTIGTVVEVVAGTGLKGIEKNKIVAALRKETGCCSSYAYRIVDSAASKKAIVRRKVDKLYVVPNQ